MTKKVVVLAAIIFAVFAGVAYATIPDNNGVIHGCYTPNKNGQESALSVFDSATGSCGRGETELDWNQTGPAGPQGAQGPQGPQGPPGPGVLWMWVGGAGNNCPTGGSCLGSGTANGSGSPSVSLNSLNGSPIYTAVFDQPVESNAGGIIHPICAVVATPYSGYTGTVPIALDVYQGQDDQLSYAPNDVSVQVINTSTGQPTAESFTISVLC